MFSLRKVVTALAVTFTFSRVVISYSVDLVDGGDLQGLGLAEDIELEDEEGGFFPGGFELPGGLGFPFMTTDPFDYKNDKVRGVNLGGWLVLEPWITPSIFAQFDNKPANLQAVDEYTFCEILGKKEAHRQLVEHWRSWVTESDIRKLASYGLNHIRIPIGYWAFDVKEGEPWVKGAFPYAVKAVDWARKYGLKVVIDVHGAPGSQNGFDNSGKRGDINWGKVDVGFKRQLGVVQRIADYFKSSKYRHVVTLIQPVNEPANWGLDMAKVKEFYDNTHRIILDASPDFHMQIHDAFLPLADWYTLRNRSWDKTLLDTHIYHMFDVERLQFSQEEHLRMACRHKQEIDRSQHYILPTVVGEWSSAVNDCTKWLNGYGRGARYDGTYITNAPVCANCTCKGDHEYWNYSPEFREWLRRFTETQMDAYEAGVGWTFWNFKAEQSPQWNYMLGVEEGWIPRDPAKRKYHC
ncbi:hypothetical protein IWQ62_006005 [Dispira parvispora]|uniref:glucan 1,3-beta-glucosidase n=1 Tax=Dispira parvispora TaxID=1520584 RepID=A0A9W8APX4_9FUNG|nr:hypothetical protein IWQ62_006005 [Dispira parvispora]